MLHDRHLLTFVLLAMPLAFAFDPGASAADRECATSSFRELGFEDGTNGLDARIAPDSACRAPASRRDHDLYAAGWQAGIRRYCEPAHAFALGDAGESYRNPCPAASASAFHDAYYAGRRVFLEASEIAQLEDALAGRVRELIGIDADLAAAEQRSPHADATESDRRERSAQTERLANARRDLAAEIDVLELEIRSRKDDLAALRHGLAEND